MSSPNDWAAEANVADPQDDDFAIDLRNQARIYAGETFRSQKPRTWQPGKSPSSYGSHSQGRRHS